MPLNVRKPQHSRQMRTVDLNDYTGGLNLRDDQFLLAENESPDLWNVDVDKSGGFQIRRPVKPFNETPLPAIPCSIFSYENAAQDSQLVVCRGDQVFWAEADGVFTSMGLDEGAVSYGQRGVTFDDKSYIVRNAQAESVAWDGSTASKLTPSGENAWQPRGVDGPGGHFPIARHVAVHQQTVWVAGTHEDGVLYPNRVRWSHPGSGENWDMDDYIDVNVGQDGDHVTAIVPFNDHLLVFKRFSVHAIFGYNADTFQVVAVSMSVGATSREAVVDTPQGVFFYCARDGVYRYDGKQVTWFFEQLFPAIRDGGLPDTDSWRVHLGWGRNRLWVAVPWAGSVGRVRCFVLDPYSGGMGAWTQYGLGVGPFFEWERPDGTTRFLSGLTGSGRVLVLEEPPMFEEVWADDFGDGPEHIFSYYRTRWVDDRQPAVKKRWKRPQLVIGETDSLSPIRVDLFRDWNKDTVIRTFRVVPTAIGTFGLVWDQGNWDEHPWDGDAVVARDVRGSPLGTSKSVQLLFIGPDTDTRWGVSGLVLKYFARPLRS